MAGAGYRSFSAGAVLTAAQVNTFLMEQSVMNFAGTAARGSALASVLSAGQMAHVGGGTVTVYDGSAWQQIYPTSPGLVYVAGTAFTTASAVSINNCFTSTYDNYRITLTFTALSVDLAVNIRLRVAGADNTTANYDSQLLYQNSTTIIGAQNTGASGNTQWATFGGFESDQPTASHMVADIIGPQQSAYTKMSGSGIIYGTDTKTYNYLLGNLFKASTSFDGFSLLTSTGTISGNVRVYGYRNA